jgi:hypothetical protein
MEVMRKQKGNIFRATSRAEAKSVFAKDTLWPLKESAIDYSLANTKSRIREVDGAPVGRVRAGAFFKDENQLTVILGRWASSQQAVIDLLKEELWDLR